MANVTVIGAQWGDEGKGKIVDWLASRADAVVRFQGGHNAGHTLVVGNQTYKLSLLPSGIVTGTLSSPQGDAEVKGSIKGATLSLAFTVQSPQGALDIKITGEVDGKTMKGVLDFGAGTADFTGTKK